MKEVFGSDAVVGIVSGDARPDFFVFTVDPSRAPPLYDYVYVVVEEVPPGEDRAVPVPVLAQIRGLKRLALGVSPEQPWPVLRSLRLTSSQDTVVAFARVLGYRWKGAIYYPRRAPQVGSRVYLAPDSMLEEFYSVEEKRRLHLGYMISRPRVRGFLDLEGIKRHVAIIAATGAGKTWASVVLIEELLRKGATILVLDPHGEYVAMKKSACRLGPEFCSSVRVVKGRRDQDGDILYRVSVSEMSADELASIAGVPSKATRIRSVISGAKTLSETVAKLLNDSSWLGLKGILRTIYASIDAAEVVKLRGGNGLEQFTVELLRRLSQSLGREAASILESELKIDEAIVRGIRRLWLVLRKDSEPAYDAARYLDELRRLGVYGVSQVSMDALLSPGTVTVVNLAGLRSEVQDHLAYNILSRVFNARLRHQRGLSGESYPYPVVVVVEEAHRFMPPRTQRHTRTRDIAAVIASEGRKFGVYMVAITQRPSRVDGDVLSQLQGQIVLRIVNPRDQEAVRDASEQISQDLLENLPGLNTGEAVVVGPLAPAPLMVRLRDRVLDYSGGDIALVEAWGGSLEETRLIEDYRREVLDKLRSLLGDHVDMEQGVTELLGARVDRETIENALRLLVRDHVWAGYDEQTATVYGEAGGYDVRVGLGEGRVKCSCGSKKPCSHSVAILLRALLDDLLTMPREEQLWTL